MSSASISAASAQPSPQARLRARIAVASTSRRAGESTLESASPAIGRDGSRITAAATTGPASGRRPASSTPAIRPGRLQSDPAWRESCRCLMPVFAPRDQFQDGLGSAGTRVPAQVTVHASVGLAESAQVRSFELPEHRGPEHVGADLRR